MVRIFPQIASHAKKKSEGLKGAHYLKFLWYGTSLLLPHKDL